MNNNEFVWTDENVKQLLRETTAYCSPEHWKKVIEDFKKSKEVKKDYEILSFEHTVLSNELNKEIIIDKTSKYFNSAFGNYEFKIHSVKRLSDGEVFTVGDKTNQGIITNFLIDWGEMQVIFGNEGSLLSGIKKLKEPLFTKEQEEYIKYFIKKELNTISQKIG